MDAMGKNWMHERKRKKSVNEVKRSIREKAEGMEPIGEGAYFRAFRDDGKNHVIKYLKPEKYFYNERVDWDPNNERKSYLHRLKILLEVEKENSGSRVREIESQFEKRFGRKPGDYEFIISRNTGIAVRPKGKWKKEEIKFFNDKLWEITKSELEFIDRLDKALWRVVKDSGVSVVNRGSSEFDPELGIVEKYEYGGDTFHRYWQRRWDPAKKNRLFKELHKHVSDIVEQSLRIYEKKGVGIDAHPSNWTITNKGSVKYIDFEPNSVVNDPESARTRLLASLAAIYMDVGYIVKDKGLLNRIKETMVKHAKKHVSESFARELSQKLSHVDGYLKATRIID